MNDEEREYWNLYQKAMNDPGCAGIIQLKRRGRDPNYYRSSFLMACEIKKGGTVHILAKEQNQSVINNWVWWLSNMHATEVNVEVWTRKEPRRNFRVSYDEIGEPAGGYYLQQKEIFTGWKLTKK